MIMSELIAYTDKASKDLVICKTIREAKEKNSEATATKSHLFLLFMQLLLLSFIYAKRADEIFFEV